MQVRYRQTGEGVECWGTTPAALGHQETTTTGWGLLNGLALLYENVYVRREVRCQQGRCCASRVWWGEEVVVGGVGGGV